jgi:hypothetical protein
MKKVLQLLSITISYHLLLFVTSSPAHAQSIGLSLSPPIFEATIAPGKSVTHVFTVSNPAETPLTLVPRIIPFVPRDETGRPELKPNLRPSWLNYFSTSNKTLQLDKPFTLKPGESRELIISITIPLKASPGDLYATLLIGTSLPAESEGPPGDGSQQNEETTLGAVIGSNLLITISPSSHPPALVKIEDFSPLAGDYLFRYGDSFFADTLSPIHFYALAKNVGKYFTKTSGSIRITSGRDEFVFSQALLPENLLASSTRLLEGSPSGEIVYRPDMLSLGVYQVSLDIRSENGSSRSEIILVLLPIKLTAGIIVCIIMLYSITKIIRRNAAKPEH